MNLTQELLRELIRYDPETGVFTWLPRERSHFSHDRQFKNWNGRYPGTVAGRVGPKGYRAIAVLDHLYPAHRLAWLYVHGRFPADQIDHINRERDDNRIANLRDVSGVENAWNKGLQRGTKTGVTGVTEYRWHSVKRYVARIRVSGRLHHLGYFDNVPDAAAARAAAERDLGVPIWPRSPTPIRSRGFPKRSANPGATP